MDELLNKLIEKGWKPFRESYINEYDFEFRNNGHTLVSCHSNEDDEYTNFDTYSWRDIVSKESGLWQFCVENKLVNKYADISDEEEAYIGKWKSGLDAIDIDGDYIRLDDDYDEYHQDTDYKYWLIESALKDESELEKFLLENIKI